MTDAEREFQAVLRAALELAVEVAPVRLARLTDARVETFAEAGMVTRSAGLVIHLPDGSEFQLTIVQSEHAKVTA